MKAWARKQLKRTPLKRSWLTSRKKEPRVKNYKRCECNTGHIHQSRGESRYSNILALRVRVREIKSYRSQVKYSYDIDGIHIANHYVDFEVEKLDGKIEIHEFKGMRTEIWKFKQRLFLAL